MDFEISTDARARERERERRDIFFWNIHTLAFRLGVKRRRRWFLSTIGYGWIRDGEFFLRKIKLLAVERVGTENFEENGRGWAMRREIHSPGWIEFAWGTESVLGGGTLVPRPLLRPSACKLNSPLVRVSMMNFENWVVISCAAREQTFESSIRWMGWWFWLK